MGRARALHGPPEADRLTPALIEKYCRALGVDVFDLDFYSGPSAFIERTRFSSDGKTRRLQL